MKIRRDFVTNSSSSSFLIARKEELTERQKAQIIQYVEENMLGEKCVDTEQDVETFMEEYGHMDVEWKEIRKVLKKGLKVYGGWVKFVDMEGEADLLQGLWEILEETDKKSFVQIDTELEY